MKPVALRGRKGLKSSGMYNTAEVKEMPPVVCLSGSGIVRRLCAEVVCCKQSFFYVPEAYSLQPSLFLSKGD